MDDKGEDMRKRFWTKIATMLLIPGLMLTVSCQKKIVQTDAAGQEISQEAADAQAAADAAKTAEELARQKALDEAARIAEENLAEEQRLAEEKRAAVEKAKNLFLYEDAYFAYDSSDLSAAAQAVLKRKAAWLKANPAVAIVVEGHCDNRGTTEYNLALGDRRAVKARGFLVDLGIDPARITSVSYGEELAADGMDEAVWARDRRAHVRIK
jgi:peptidoglycan-associated lipoprotein